MLEEHYMNPMRQSEIKVCIDHLCFWEKYGGVSKYFVELIKRFPPETVKFLLKFTNNEYVKELPNIKTHTVLPNKNFKGKARLISEIGKIVSIPQLIKGNFDIYHPSHYDGYGLNIIPKRIRTVATIHDLNYFKIPQFYPPNSRNKRNQERMIKEVNHIIAISNKTKDDLQELFGVEESKISVIYHGIDTNWIRNSRPIEYLEPYFLFVGRRSEYKNYKSVLYAMQIVKLKFPEIKLYCAGLQPSQSEIQLIKDLGLVNNVKFISASNEELANLYKQALGFIFPSFYEGFGLPILEAMSANCPTIISNASCFPEIAKDASLYFSPENQEELAYQMLRLIDDNSLRQDLIARGNERIKDFSWDKSAQQHMEVYKSLI